MSHAVLEDLPLFPHTRGKLCWFQEQHQLLSQGGALQKGALQLYCSL